MLSLEDRQRLRALAQPVEPQRDLWPAIAARLETPSHAPQRRYAWFAIAASLAGVALLSGAIAARMFQADKIDHVSAAQRPPAVLAVMNNPAERWNPSDPRLRGAATELRTAQVELKQALAIAPHSDYLERLLDRTQRQQARLSQLDLGAG
ncbi:MAG: hypothetical protein ABIY40_08630 [Rhodanobacteraceae bacterium]